MKVLFIIGAVILWIALGCVTYKLEDYAFDDEDTDFVAFVITIVFSPILFALCLVLILFRQLYRLYNRITGR